MGILAGVKDRAVGNFIATADKGANLLAKASGLSSGQLEKVEEQRRRFLSEMPETNPEGIKRLLGSYAIEAFEAYLPQISTLYDPIDLGNADDRINIINRIRYFEIVKWVSDPNENSLDKLTNLYQVVSEEDCNVALVYCRKKEGCKIYLAVVNNREGDEPTIAEALKERLSGSLKGNFPGAEIRERNKKEKGLYGIGMIPELESMENVSIASVSNIATEKSEDFVNQSMEKLLDGICPEAKDKSDEYVIVLLATPVKEQLERRNALSELYSKLAPYSAWETNFTYSEANSQGSSANFGVSLGVSAGLQFGKSSTEGSSSSISNANTEGTAHTDSSSTSTTNTISVGGGGTSHAKTKTKGTADTISKSKTVTDTMGKMSQAGQNVGNQIGANFGAQFSRTSNVTVTIGKNEGIVQNYVNHGIKYTLDLIEKQMKRLEESSALGMWDFSAYFLSKSAVVANNAAHMYLALTQGKESYISQSAVNLWDSSERNGNKRQQVDNILKFVKRLQHPQFQLKELDNREWLMYPPHINAAVSLTGREMARSLNFPQKSVSGLPVLESVSFGREVQKFSNHDAGEAEEIEVGRIYHMHRDEAKNVRFDKKSLTAHTFITGSTGTGKSNAIYQILDKLCDMGVKFLVVEPAKGEYKKVLGGRCKVYGTNRSQSDLLRTNPFSFPDGIHVLEHIDRLIEILNACWPMYAAMPAILKDAIERSYEKAGWNLNYSRCEPCVFPTFEDLKEILPEVLQESAYSDDTKNDYSGALVTRINSLTNGLNGQMLCNSNELSNEELFGKNVIIDLSRVGSNETKSMLMGIIVMKLQEYRISLDAMNEDLVHVTVLEEAHNLLRKTTVAQSQEGSNLQGKSVEMISNSIAEMRTYGEGFIIADQAPELLDETVIRNTNTKIVLRLPGESDRKTVGSSMALTEAQITELAKLPRGVAAVYQNDWVESVLCHFEKYEKMDPYKYEPKDNAEMFEHFFHKVFGVKDNYEIKEEEAEQLREWILNLKDMPRTRRMLLDILECKKVSGKDKENIAYNVFDGKKVAKILEKEPVAEEGIKKADRFINSFIGTRNHRLIENIRNMIIRVIFSEFDSPELRNRYMQVEMVRRKIL